MRAFLRRVSISALTLGLGIFSVLPHQHGALAAELLRGTIEQIGICKTPTANHFHSGREVEPHPCAACLRNHVAGPIPSLLAPVAQTIVLATIVAAVLRPAAATHHSSVPRGPPA